MTGQIVDLFCLSVVLLCVAMLWFNAHPVMVQVHMQRFVPQDWRGNLLHLGRARWGKAWIWRWSWGCDEYLEKRRGMGMFGGAAVSDRYSSEQ